MCGILGIANWSKIEGFDECLNSQFHRGPDDSGVWQICQAEESYFKLGSNRLAILDLSPAGHMPMSTPDGKLTIVYNGEVYNYPQIRKSLEDKGYSFRSNSDTEAILYLYQEIGPECVKQLNGMFAIAICDLRGGEPILFLARDHFGIKPLYYSQQGTKLAFASEIKSLLGLPDFPRTINYPALHQYLTFLWVPDPLTLFEGIYKLPAGHYAIWKNAQLKLTKFWDINYPKEGYVFPVSEADLAEELRERFTETVKSQISHFYKQPS